MNNQKSYRPRIKCPACGSTLLFAGSKEIMNTTTVVAVTDETEITSDLIFRCRHCKSDIMLSTDAKKYEMLINKLPLKKSLTA